MNALAFTPTVAVTGRCDCEGHVPCLGLLWVIVDDPQPKRETPKAFAVAHHKWHKLQFGAIGSDMEQSGRMGWCGG